MLSRYRETVSGWTDPVGRALFRLHLRPNHLTVMGLGVSLFAAAAFVEGHPRTAGVLLLVAGFFDFFDGSLARASGQVTPFGAFLDSVIDRYSDLVVLLGIVVLFARTPNPRGAIVAMAGLVGSVMVSYTKARAESIGVTCNIGFMERPERMICLIAGAMLDLLEPALWVLAVLANLTALQRIVFTRRAMRAAAIVPVLVVALMLTPPVDAGDTPPETTEKAWKEAVAAYQAGDARPLVTEFARPEARESPIGDYVAYVLADALAREGDLSGARTVALEVADRYKDSRLAPIALLLAATLAAGAADDAGAQALLVRLVDSYPDSAELPEALYLLATAAEARGDLEAAAAAYRELMILLPTNGYADGAADRLAALASAGVQAPFSLPQRIDRAERLLRGGVPQTAAEEAERIAQETRDPGIAVRALKVVAEASQRLGRYDVAARAIELAIDRAPRDRKPGLRLDHARLLARGGKRAAALPVLDSVATAGTDAEAADALSLKARLLEELNRESDAAAAYRAIVARYPAREAAGAALWRLGWLAYLKRDEKNAGQSWTRLSQLPGGRAYRVAALYWTARATERSSRASAERLYERVIRESPRSYYGMLAARRVTAPSDGAAEPAIRLPADPTEAVADDPAFVRVELLRRIGLVELAWQELEEVVRRSVGDTVRLYGLTNTYVKEERYHLALRILRRHFAALASTGHASLPRAFWEMLYPFGWKEDVTEAAQRAGLDPYFVAAVVREESSYYPRATSRAGARGLMQLMPRTAQPMAEVQGLEFRGGDLLDEPIANLQIGTSFLAGLMKEFGDPRLALAAYNAGPGRLRQWWQARRTDDIEAFVEQIPFDETRQYVKRVTLSWEEYRRIYAPRP